MDRISRMMLAVLLVPSLGYAADLQTHPASVMSSEMQSVQTIPSSSRTSLEDTAVEETDVSNATALSVSPSALRPVTINRAINDGYLHSLGVNVSDGTLHPADIGSVLASLPVASALKVAAGEAYPVGENGSATTSISSEAFNHVFVRADGQLLSPIMDSSQSTGDPAWNGGHVSDKVGDTALVEAFEPKWGLMKDRTYTSDSIFDYATKRMPAPLTSDFYTLDSQRQTPPECASTAAEGYD